MSHKSNNPAKAAYERATGAEKSNKHITKITAKPSNSSEKPSKTAPEAALTKDRAATALAAKNSGNTSENRSESKTLNKKAARLAKKQAKAARKNQKSDRAEKPLKDVFVLTRPFVALGRYIRDSWCEIRRVRWPNRKATWKMTGAVLAYCIAFMVFIVLLDSLFTWLFSLIIK